MLGEAWVSMTNTMGCDWKSQKTSAWNLLARHNSFIFVLLRLKNWPHRQVKHWNSMWPMISKIFFIKPNCISKVASGRCRIY